MMSGHSTVGGKMCQLVALTITGASHRVPLLEATDVQPAHRQILPGGCVH